MKSQREFFLRHVGQTSDSPMMLEVERAEGVYLFGRGGKRYLDLISGISVNNLGHRHPAVIRAIREQAERYLHLMPYGECIQDPTVDLARRLASLLPGELSTVFFVNSGCEAVEGAMKLAKRYTGRSEIIAFRNGYHGSTQGALSVLADETMKGAFRPLIPGVRFLDFNSPGQLDRITRKTACVLVEPIQGEAGIILPGKNFLPELRKRCTDTGSLLVFDEIQTGFGRTGTLFAFEAYRAVPDILLLAKGMGGGMPIGALVSSPEILSVFRRDPPFGHISTFGGHPVCCAAALASLKVIARKGMVSRIGRKGELFKKLLRHPAIQSVRGKGLFLALELENPGQVKRVVSMALSRGLVTDWFLFCDRAIRISPPLTITEYQIRRAVTILLECINACC